MAKASVGQNLPNFYVYEIVVDGIRRYVGKGHRDRCKEHLRTAKRISRIRASGKTYRTSRFYNRLVRALDSGAAIETRIISYFLCERDALDLERVEIATIPKRERWNTLDGGEGFTSEDLKRRWRDPAYRQRMSKQSKENWLDPVFRENQVSIRSGAAYQQTARASLKAALSRPEVRQKMSDRKKDALANPATRADFLSKMNASRRTPEARANNAAAKKAAWADPVYRARITELQNAGKAKAKASKEK